MTLGPLGAFWDSVTKSTIPVQTSVPALGCGRVPSAVTLKVKYFNSLVIESLCVPKAWLARQEQLGQGKDLPKGLADCKVSALDNLTCWTSQMARECWTLGLLCFSAGWQRGLAIRGD